MTLLYSIFACSVLLAGLVATLSIRQLESSNSRISSFQHSPETGPLSSKDSALQDSY